MDARSRDDPASLIEQIARGDHEAFGRFYDRYASLVFTLAMRLVRERSAAEDLLQEVFLQVWRQAGNYSPERGSPEAWIITMTRSRGIDRLRSIRRRERNFVTSRDSAREADEGRSQSPAKESEAGLTVKSALARLPDAERVVLELAYFDGLTQSEIAARLRQPLGTVKTRMRTGVRHLREFIGSED